MESFLPKPGSIPALKPIIAARAASSGSIPVPVCIAPLIMRRAPPLVIKFKRASVKLRSIACWFVGSIVAARPIPATAYGRALATAPPKLIPLEASLAACWFLLGGCTNPPKEPAPGICGTPGPPPPATAKAPVPFPAFKLAAMSADSSFVF